MDSALVTQAHARLYQSDSPGAPREFNAFGSGSEFITKPPTELLMICVDTSKSMDESAEFPSKNDLQLSISSDESDSDNDSDDDSDEDEELNNLVCGDVSWSKEEAIGFSLPSTVARFR